MIRTLLWVAAVSVALAGVNRALAQNQSQASRHKEKFHLALSKTYNMQAHDHARLLDKYAALVKSVPAEIVGEHASAIRTASQAAKKNFAKLAKSAPNNVDLAKQIERLQKRLDQVTDLTKQLEGQAAEKESESQTLRKQLGEISRLLRTNHDAVKRIDDDFYDSSSDDYYLTGEGHFVD
jgi:hypothetical protein